MLVGSGSEVLVGGGSGVFVSVGRGRSVSVGCGGSVSVGAGVKVSLGTGVDVRTVTVGTAVAVLVAVGGGDVFVLVGTAVFVLAGKTVSVHTGVRVDAGSRTFVGGNRKECNENGVGLGVREEPETGIKTKLNVPVGTAVISTVAVDGRTIAVGTSSETNWNASAAAVEFMLTTDPSAVLRIRMSIAVGGFGLNPAITTIIHAMPAQRNKAVKACSGAR